MINGVKDRVRRGVQHQLNVSLDPLAAKVNLLEERSEACLRSVCEVEVSTARLEADMSCARRAALLSCELQGFEHSLKGCSGKRILVAGWYGADNLGDELMMRSVLEHMPPETRRRTAVLLWDNPTYDRLNLDPLVHPIHYPATTRELDAVVDYFDVVIWGGGAILDDGQFNDDVNNFNTGNLFIRISELMIGRGKEVYCLGLSANESISNKRYVEHLRNIAANANRFSLRDPQSKEVLVSAGVPSEHLVACDDLVFALKELEDGKRAIDKNVYTLGFVFLHTMGLLDTYASVVEACASESRAHAEGKEVRVRLIPFMNEGHYDESMNEVLKDKLSNAGIEAELADYSPKVTDSPILGCDALVSYKYHSALIACCYGIPCLLVSRGEHPHYANKMRYLAMIAGIEDQCVPSRELEENPSEWVAKFFASPVAPRIDPLVRIRVDENLNEICAGL